MLALFEEMLALIDADFTTARSTRPGSRAWSRACSTATRKDPFRDIAKDYPRSSLGGVLVVEEAGGGANPAGEVDRAKALLARFPRNALVAADTAFVLRKAGRIKEAMAIWSAARAQRPESPFLRGVFAPENASRRPASLTNAEAHAKELAAPVDSRRTPRRSASSTTTRSASPPSSRRRSSPTAPRSGRRTRRTA